MIGCNGEKTLNILTSVVHMMKKHVLLWWHWLFKSKPNIVVELILLYRVCLG